MHTPSLLSSLIVLDAPPPSPPLFKYLSLSLSASSLSVGFHCKELHQTITHSTSYVLQSKITPIHLWAVVWPHSPYCLCRPIVRHYSTVCFPCSNWIRLLCLDFDSCSLLQAWGFPNHINLYGFILSMLYIVCWLHKQYGLFWRLSRAGAFFAMLLRLSCPLNQPSPPIHLPIRPPARTVVARRQEVFEPAILFGSMRLRWWLGGWAGGVESPLSKLPCGIRNRPHSSAKHPGRESYNMPLSLVTDRQWGFNGCGATPAALCMT